MSVTEDWQSMKNVQKWIWGLITPALFVTSVSLIFLWTFLFRIGREDLFLQVISFKEFSPAIAFFSVVSFTCYIVIYFMQSLVLIAPMRRAVKNFQEYSRVKFRYIISFSLCSLLSSMTLYLVSFFYPHLKSEWLVPSEFLFMAIVNICICYILNRRVLNNKTKYMSGRDSLLFKLKYHIAYPLPLGISAWFFVFPMGLIIRYIDFQQGAGLLTQMVFLMIITISIIFFSLLPAIIYLNLPTSMSLTKQASGVVLAIVSAIFMSSVIAPVIPVQIINFSMRLSGATSNTLLNYALSKEDYPVEMFKNGNWDIKDSENGKQYIITGFSMFSVGSINLICPEEVSGALAKSMKFILLDVDNDNKLRAELSKATAMCNVLAKGDYKFWRKI